MPPSPRWPKYTWDDQARQYRDGDGRFVPRTAVRQVLDETIDSAGFDMRADAAALQAGKINLVEWQLRMERNIKAIHTSSVAAASGGWAQVDPAGWSAAAVRIRFEYARLDDFARDIANGLPLDGRFLVRAASYAGAGSRTYERVLRRADLATGRVIAERRLLHSLHPCISCVAYEAMGWQEPGVLPDIGEDCLCEGFCRCSFERKFRRRGVPETVAAGVTFTPSAAAKAQRMTTVMVDVAKLDEAFQKDTGFAIGPGGAGAITGRREAFLAFLAKARAEGKPVEQPQVTVDPEGGVAFVDGRHRFSVLRDQGVERLPISVPRSQAARARRFFGPD